MRVGTEAYLAQITYLEILRVGVGLRRSPAAFRQLKRVREVLKDRGIDTETFPVLPTP
jgi:RpiR family carbohydrate utilization transcriptional regulator